jgi:hypothetical protein
VMHVTFPWPNRPRVRYEIHIYSDFKLSIGLLPVYGKRLGKILVGTLRGNYNLLFRESE